jgi:hypothetical protein
MCEIPPVCIEMPRLCVSDRSVALSPHFIITEDWYTDDQFHESLLLDVHHHLHVAEFKIGRCLWVHLQNVPPKFCSQKQPSHELSNNYSPRKDALRQLLSRANWFSHAINLVHLMTSHDFLDAVLSDFCQLSGFASPIRLVFGCSLSNLTW